MRWLLVPAVIYLAYQAGEVVGEYAYYVMH